MGTFALMFCVKSKKRENLCKNAEFSFFAKNFILALVTPICTFYHKEDEFPNGPVSVIHGQSHRFVLNLVTS